MLGYQLQTLSHSAYTHYIMCIFSYSTYVYVKSHYWTLRYVCMYGVYLPPCMWLSRETAAGGDVIAIGCRGLHTCGWSGRAALGDLLGFSRWSSSAPGLQPASSPPWPPSGVLKNSVSHCRQNPIGWQVLNFKTAFEFQSIVWLQFVVGWMHIYVCYAVAPQGLFLLYSMSYPMINLLHMHSPAL